MDPHHELVFHDVFRSYIPPGLLTYPEDHRHDLRGDRRSNEFRESLGGVNRAKIMESGGAPVDVWSPVCKEYRILLQRQLFDLSVSEEAWKELLRDLKEQVPIYRKPNGHGAVTEVVKRMLVGTRAFDPMAHLVRDLEKSAETHAVSEVRQFLRSRQGMLGAAVSRFRVGRGRPKTVFEELGADAEGTREVVLILLKHWSRDALRSVLHGMKASHADSQEFVEYRRPMPRFDLHRELEIRDAVASVHDEFPPHWLDRISARTLRALKLEPMAQAVFQELWLLRYPSQVNESLRPDPDAVYLWDVSVGPALNKAVDKVKQEIKEARS